MFQDKILEYSIDKPVKNIMIRDKIFCLFLVYLDIFSGRVVELDIMELYHTWHIWWFQALLRAGVDARDLKKIIFFNDEESFYN